MIDSGFRIQHFSKSFNKKVKILFQFLKSPIPLLYYQELLFSKLHYNVTKLITERKRSGTRGFMLFSNLLIETSI